ncbi:hypothetical protein F5146DRAFT_1000306 [Armillaria mellea]|nr:hypothetical protein F5146DRAFT_1000306 [Armillaria mellea]
MPIRARQTMLMTATMQPCTMQPRSHAGYHAEFFLPFGANGMVTRRLKLDPGAKCGPPILEFCTAKKSNRRLWVIASVSLTQKGNRMRQETLQKPRFWGPANFANVMIMSGWGPDSKLELEPVLYSRFLYKAPTHGFEFKRFVTQEILSFESMESTYLLDRGIATSGSLKVPLSIRAQALQRDRTTSLLTGWIPIRVDGSSVFRILVLCVRSLRPEFR